MWRLTMHHFEAVKGRARIVRILAKLIDIPTDDACSSVHYIDFALGRLDEERRHSLAPSHEIGATR
jgi:hypothetical protein